MFVIDPRKSSWWWGWWSPNLELFDLSWTFIWRVTWSTRTSNTTNYQYSYWSITKIWSLDIHWILPVYSDYKDAFLFTTSDIVWFSCGWWSSWATPFWSYSRFLINAPLKRGIKIHWFILNSHVVFGNTSTNWWLNFRLKAIKQNWDIVTIAERTYSSYNDFYTKHYPRGNMSIDIPIDSESEYVSEKWDYLVIEIELLPWIANSWNFYFQHYAYWSSYPSNRVEIY